MRLRRARSAVGPDSTVPEIAPVMVRPRLRGQREGRGGAAWSVWGLHPLPLPALRVAGGIWGLGFV